jgi:hypothetical protein
MTNERPKKIISGSYNYVRRLTREWVHAGYSIVKTKQWSDGKWTITLEKK